MVEASGAGIEESHWKEAVRSMQRTSSAMLAPSSKSFDGVGVLALRDIPAGCEVFSLPWPEQTLEAPGLVRIRWSWLKGAKLPDHVLGSLRRRFYWDGEWQAVPVSLDVFMCHSLQQYVNEVDQQDQFANVVYNADDDTWQATCRIERGRELLVDRGTAASARPGARAPMVDDALEVRWLLEWVAAAPPVHLAASSIHGIGQIATASIPEGEQLQLSASELHVGHRTSLVPHAWIMRDLSEVERQKLRMHFIFTEGSQVVPLTGFNRITFQQLRNHEAPPVLRRVHAESRNLFQTLRPIAQGEDLTEDIASISQTYIDWAVNRCAGPWEA